MANNSSAAEKTRRRRYRGNGIDGIENVRMPAAEVEYCMLIAKSRVQQRPSLCLFSNVAENLLRERTIICG